MRGTLICTCMKRLPIFVAILFITNSYSQNAITIENALPGNPSSEWMISGAGDLSIQGFATDISVNKGNRVHFKIDTDAPAYTIRIYRLGWYNGDGARFMGNGVITATLPQVQPDPISNTTTGLVDCGNWNESAHWDIPSSAVSGIYIARLRRTDNGGASHIVFIVRDDASNSDLFFQTSDATWHAYNVYGGNSLYLGTTDLPAGHASHVSYNRPFLNRNGGGGGGVAADFLFNAEYSMLRFLERNGYDVTYTTNVDAARNGSLIQNHKVFLSVGHDEYWSAEQRANVEAARDAGVHLAFFSGNEIYWKTRWENSADGSNTPYRTLVCYKEGIIGENVCGEKCDPTPEWTGLWRSGCNYPGAGGCNPENSLTGQISWQNSTTSIRVPATFRDHRFWRNTSVASLSPGDEVVMPNGTLGHEWNWEQFPDSYPNGRIVLSSTTSDGRTHKLSLYHHPSGAMVFGAGTIQWSWGLDNFHDVMPAAGTSADMQQATVNLLADMGVQPQTLMAGLSPASASTDVTAPTSSISTPADGATVPAFPLPVITGTAADAGGVVGGVEVSVDGGVTWRAASGTTNWTFSWTPTVMGSTNVKVRAFDDSGNMQVLGDEITINVVDPQCPCSIFQPTDEPQLANHMPGGIEVGVKFRPAFDGYIWGLRFYKTPNDVGTHIGTLWTLDGTMIGRVTFRNETASGWQETLFGAPIPVSANTTYVASYHSPTGNYAESNPFFSLGSVVNGPLTAIEKTHPDGPNGVYEPSATAVFPNENYDSENYWVDVVYNTASGPDVTGPSPITISPANGATGVAMQPSITVTFDEPMDPASISNTSVELRNAANAIVPSNISYNAGTKTMTLVPNAALNFEELYTVTLLSGASGVKDVSGNSITPAFSWSFTTDEEQLLPPNQGPGGPILVIHDPSNPYSMYSAEILRAEGLNEFAILDIATVTATPALLNTYDVVILGQMNINASQATMFSNWVTAGGTFIALRPSTNLSTLLGITPQGGTLSNRYLLVNTTSGPGVGIVNQTIQFHSTADLYTLNGASSLATLYSDATTATTNPAVTMRDVGPNGGRAIAFTYDLARSIVYTRQGNPAWAGQNRDGNGPIRSNDLFFGAMAGDVQPDWIDFNKISIPQADEQQRLLVNIIIQSNLDRKPLPRFWFLPSGHKAAVVMTGDDHQIPANSGTAAQFNYFMSQGPNTAQDILDWKAIRGTSYIYPGTMNSADVTFYQSQGFEISLHTNTSCADVTPFSYENFLSTQLSNLAGAYPTLEAPVSHRTHCVVWSDWATVAKIQTLYGIRADANYYYWPASWVQNRPGLFTGSGYPMRFADTDGTFIDSYQFATQISDESSINYSLHINSLLDKAIGPEAYYAVVTTNIHTDSSVHSGMNAVISSALARNIPVVSTKQMLTWLDGRDNSSFYNITWAANQLNFSVFRGGGARNLQGMLPYNVGSDVLISLTRDGSPISFSVQTIKGMQYAFFDATTAAYVATYGVATSATLTGRVTLQGRPAPPHASLAVPVVVELYQGGNPVPVQTHNVSTDANAEFIIPNIPAGTYTIAVKHSHTLQRVAADEVLVNGTNVVEFGTLLEGDANDENIVDALDFSIMLSTFNKVLGEPGFDARADFNNDNVVDALDFSLLISNFNVIGENP